MDLREPTATATPRSPCVASRRSATGVVAGVRWWLLVMMLSAGCSRGDPEVALRKAVDGLHQAVEARDPAAVQQLLAADFIGNDGLDRDGARRLMAAMLLRHRELGSTLGPLQVTMAEGHADVRFSGALPAFRIPPRARRVCPQGERSWLLSASDKGRRSRGRRSPQRSPNGAGHLWRSRS